MRMLSRFIAASALVAASFTAAHASEAPKSFTYEGTTYVYTAKNVGSATIVTGSMSPDKTPFSLRIKGSRVSGVIAGRYVSFPVKESFQAMRSSAAQVTMR